jgi:hypothetical protein
MSKYINSTDRNHEIAEDCESACLSSIDLLNLTLEWFNIRYTTWETRAYSPS